MIWAVSRQKERPQSSLLSFHHQASTYFDNQYILFFWICCQIYNSTLFIIQPVALSGVCGAVCDSCFVFWVLWSCLWFVFCEAVFCILWSCLWFAAKFLPVSSNKLSAAGATIKSPNLLHNGVFSRTTATHIPSQRYSTHPGLIITTSDGSLGENQLSNLPHNALQWSV